MPKSEKENQNWRNLTLIEFFIRGTKKHVEVHTWPVNNIQRERGILILRPGMDGEEEELKMEKSSVSIWFSLECSGHRLWQHSLISLPRRTYTLEDTGFPHGVELLDRIVLLVEVRVGLFPGLCYCVLLRKVRFIHRFSTSPRQSLRFLAQVEALTGSTCSTSPTGMVLDS